MSEVEQNLELEQAQNENPGEEAPEEQPKKELTPEQRLGINRRNFSRLAEELGVEVERPWLKKPESPEKPNPVEKNEFDDTENLLLDVKNVEEGDREWLFKEHKSTGKNLRSLLGFKYVQEYLGEQSQKRATEAGLPSGNNRSGGGGGNTAEGWVAKIESGKATLADIPDFKLRSEVVKLREHNDKSSNRPNW